jgi:hypothetical protein
VPNEVKKKRKEITVKEENTIQKKQIHREKTKHGQEVK